MPVPSNHSAPTLLTVTRLSGSSPAFFRCSTADRIVRPTRGLGVDIDQAHLLDALELEPGRAAVVAVGFRANFRDPGVARDIEPQGSAALALRRGLLSNFSPMTMKNSRYVQTAVFAIGVAPWLAVR